MGSYFGHTNKSIHVYSDFDCVLFQEARGRGVKGAGSSRSGSGSMTLVAPKQGFAHGSRRRGLLWPRLTHPPTDPTRSYKDQVS